MAFFVFLVVGFIILSIACIFIVRYFKSPSVTGDVTIAVYFSWVLGFAGILLLPYDMSEALLNETKSFDLSLAWHFIYWSTFILAWGFLPIQMAYHTSGEFDFKAKIREAFWQNIISYVASAVAGFVYIVIKVSVSAVSPSEVIGFLMALGNTYGVLLIIFLMGNGLVALPRRLWQLGNPETELRRLYMLAPAVESSYCDARFALEDCEDEVKRISQKNQGDHEIEHMTLIIQERVTSFAYSGRSTSLQHRHNASENARETDSTKKGLVALHKRVIQAQLKVLACDRRWSIVLSRARQLEVRERGWETIGYSRAELYSPALFSALDSGNWSPTRLECILLNSYSFEYKVLGDRPPRSPSCPLTKPFK